MCTFYVLVCTDILWGTRGHLKCSNMRSPTRRPVVTNSRVATSALQEPAPTPEQQFVMRGRQILTEWHERAVRFPVLDTFSQIRTEEPNQWLRRECYAFIRETQKSTPRLMANLVRELDGKHRRGRRTNAQPYKRGLLLMSAMPDMRSAELQGVALPDFIADHRRRADFSAAMTYASKNKVPPRFFNAFCRYVGMGRMKKRLAEGLREPGFEREADRSTPRTTSRRRR